MKFSPKISVSWIVLIQLLLFLLVVVVPVRSFSISSNNNNRKYTSFISTTTTSSTFRSSSTTQLSALDEKQLPIPPPPPPKPVTTSSTTSSIDPTIGLAAAISFVGAFAIGTFLLRNRNEEEQTETTTTIVPTTTTTTAATITTTPPATTSTTVVDLSIPYDAAARLAYDEWRATYNKGAFDATKFETFKTNYEIVTVANVAAKQQARQTNTLPTLQSFDANADSTTIVSSSTSSSATTTTTAVAAPVTSDVDVTVPYDAAALLAYDEWRKQYNKGDYDASKFQKFKLKYEEITVANIIAKRKVEGTKPILLELDATADQ